jgi:GntR family transcriptional regulator
MLFRSDIDTSKTASAPIFQQIVDQVIFEIASGSRQAGEMLPSVRILGDRLQIHPNTIARAYQVLESKGIVATSRGRGMVVTAEAPQLCRQERQEIIRKRIRAALREAVSSAMSADEIRRLVEEELAHVNGQAK